MDNQIAAAEEKQREKRAARTDFFRCGKTLGLRGDDLLGSYGGDLLPSDYEVMRDLIKNAGLHYSDHFVEIGCGHGRVLLEMIYRHFRGRLFGIEIDPQKAAFCEKLFRRKHPVTIYVGDALELLAPETSALYLCNPFGAEQMQALIEKIEKICTQAEHPMQVIYERAFHAGLFSERPGWSVYYHDYHYRYYPPEACERKLPCMVYTYNPLDKE